MATTITSGEIGRRLGVCRHSAWRWGRQGKYGPPVDPMAGVWRWLDDEMLALTISDLRPHRRRGECAAALWANVERMHLRRIVGFADGTRPTDKEDLELCSLILSVAARRFSRRAEGRRSPATVSAFFLAEKMLARKRAGDGDIPKRLLGTAVKLSELAEKPKENAQPGN